MCSLEETIIGALVAFYVVVSWFFLSAWGENLSKIYSLIKSSCCHQNRLIHAFTKYCIYLQWMRHFFLRSFLYPVIISHSIMSDQCLWLIFRGSLSRFCTVDQINFHKNLAEILPMSLFPFSVFDHRTKLYVILRSKLIDEIKQIFNRWASLLNSFWSVLQSSL